MRVPIRATLKNLYYKSMFVVRRLFLSKPYRFECGFIENIRAQTYTDLYHKEMQLRSITHQLDKILTFNKRRNMDLMVDRIEKLMGDVARDEHHDPAVVSWSKNVLDTYHKQEFSHNSMECKKMEFIREDCTTLKKIIETRRSIRSYVSGRIDKEIVSKILGAGLWAPSGCNRQTIEYLVVENKEDIRYCQRIAGEGYPFPQEASLAIVVLVDPRSYALPNQRHMAYLEGGAAIQNMLLMAHVLNLGSCWLFWDGREKSHHEFIRKFHLKAWLLPVSMVCLGYIDKVPPYCPARKDLDKSIHYPV